MYVLKKDLPTIKAGRIIELSKDGKYGTPILMSIEANSCVHYMFPINILKNEKEWFSKLDSSKDDGITPFIE